MPIAKGFEEPRELPTSVTFSSPWNLVARALNAVAGTKDPTGQAMGLAQPMGGVVVPIRRFSPPSGVRGPGGPAYGEQVAGWLKQYFPKVWKVLEESPRYVFTKRSPLYEGARAEVAGGHEMTPAMVKAARERVGQPPSLDEPVWSIDVGKRLDDWFDPIAAAGHEGTHIWGGMTNLGKVGPPEAELALFRNNPLEWARRAKAGMLHYDVVKDPDRLRKLIRHVTENDPSLVRYWSQYRTGRDLDYSLGELANEATARHFMRKAGLTPRSWENVRWPKSMDVGEAKMQSYLPEWNELVTRMLSGQR